MLSDFPRTSETLTVDPFVTTENINLLKQVCAVVLTNITHKAGKRVFFENWFKPVFQHKLTICSSGTVCKEFKSFEFIE